jgi:4-diphosphocytidyl-2-C-methyl-D-erythritol kinase
VPPTADGLTVFAPAKINLYLHVGDRRADGFHDLESVVVFADVGDSLSFAPADGLSLHLDGPFGSGLQSDDNLVLKASRAFAERTGQPANARITLTKNLPIASGIGGGSADAAATLRGLAEIYPGAATAQQLAAIAADVGSDVSACLVSKPLLMRGRGEDITPLPRFPALPAVLINPGVAVGTADVFRGLKTRTGADAAKPIDTSSAAALLRALRTTTTNDLEPPARAVAPVIGDVLDELRRMPGIQLARMSGSGATCFGIFESAFEAELAVTALESTHTDWWIKTTTLSKST